MSSRILVAYAIVAWLLIEMAATVFPALKLPDWTVTFRDGADTHQFSDHPAGCVGL